MKKYILPLIVCALAAVSCEFSDEYYVSNVNDLVTARDNSSFMSDYGVLYTVKNDLTDRKWTVGERYMINFDIENANYEISLKQYTRCIISTPSAVDDTPSPGEDPVIVTGSNLSGGYVNLNLSYYVKKESTYPHRIFMEYQDNPNSGNLELILIHDGNGENPSQMGKDDLDTVNGIYSFVLTGLIPKGESRLLQLTVNEMNGTSITKKTYQLYNEYITF